LASNLRRSRRTFGQRFLETETKVSSIVRRGTPTRIGSRVITSDNIAPGAITALTLSAELNENVASIQASANGKNVIYRQPSEPTGGNYKSGDIWFDTDDDNKFYRYQEDPVSPGWVGFTLGDNALDSISANKITAGTIDASVITVSNIDAANITTGTLTGRILSGNTIVGGTITIGSGTTIFKADTNGIYLGNSTFASAPFRVTPAGAMTATSGSIAGWTITSTELQSGSLYINSSGAAYLATILSDSVGGFGNATHTGGASSMSLKTKGDSTTIGFLRNISYGATKPTTANLTVGDIHFS
jgi:hypothetical protein